MSEQCAVPLCLPNNCKWDKQTGEYSKSAGPRESLCVVDAAIERLKSIKGRVYHCLEYSKNLLLNVSVYFDKMIYISKMTT